jgi:hypothetical protein
MFLSSLHALELVVQIVVLGLRVQALVEVFQLLLPLFIFHLSEKVALRG